MRIVSLWSVAVLSTMCAAGCVAEEAPPRAADGATASISFPLIHYTGVATYRLSGHLAVTEADGTVQDVDATADVPEVIIPVSPGLSRIELLPGWTLSRSDGGPFVPVSALVGSANPVDLATPANRTTTWVLDFLVQDSGSAVRVVFGVLEHPQQLTSILNIQSASNGYVEYVGETVDVEIFMRAGSTPIVDAQGNHARLFHASSFATQVYGDHHGKLAALLGDLAGGSLDMQATNYEEGFDYAAGSVQGSGIPTSPLLSFVGPASFGLDPDGTPSTAGFAVLGGPFTIWSGAEYVVSGTISSGVYQDN